MLRMRSSQRLPRRGDNTAQRADGIPWLVRQNPHRPRSMVSHLYVPYMDNSSRGMLFTALDYGLKVQTKRPDTRSGLASPPCSMTQPSSPAAITTVAVTVAVPTVPVPTVDV